MKEIFGNIWDYSEDPNAYLVIPTNGTTNQHGFAVMGAGIALQAVMRRSDIRKRLGNILRTGGNHVFYIDEKHLSFPVKHHWIQKADIILIERSARELRNLASARPNKVFVLARPGCGNGRLKWEDVKPIIENILPDNVHVIDLK